VTASGIRGRWLSPAVALFGVFVYLDSLDGLYIPHIGDEAPYIEIARLTASNGSWLPLQTASGLENTKPPLLFWVGIAATGWASEWTLLRLRLPIAAFTFATAALTFWLCRKLGHPRETAWLSALTFLGFYSSFQYGRPFLTNSPETFLVFLSFSLVLVYREAWIPAGIALGIACLFKSFALIAPVGLALLLVSGRRRLLHVGLTVALALAIFGLWPLLDPDPGSVIRNFVLEENLGKLQGQGYLRGLVSGPYALHWLWLGHFGNAGLFALPLLALIVATIRGRKTLCPEEKSLWILVLSFLLVYSIPSQRQENYLIPTTPALAILIARRWSGFPEGWFRWFALPGAFFAFALLTVVLGIREDALPPGSYAGWELAVPVIVLGLWIALLVRPGAGRYSFHALVFASFFLIGLAVAPFEGPLGRFAPEGVAFLRGKRVFVPSEFVSRHERHRFLLPGARIEGYDAADADSASRLLSRGQHVVVYRAPGAGIEGPFRTIARRYDLRSRQTAEEMWRIFYHREIDLLVRQELVVRRHRRDRMDGKGAPN
jgi:4-amino-4-deoxy-L-arabinose transferase-like glycosyltransferase